MDRAEICDVVAPQRAGLDGVRELAVVARLLGDVAEPLPEASRRGNLLVRADRRW